MNLQLTVALTKTATLLRLCCITDAAGPGLPR